MIKYDEIYKNTTNDAFANIDKPGIYKGRLMAVKISLQDEKFVVEGQTPKHQVSFLFDCKNKQGEHVHVASKPMGISFTDKSNLPKFWENVEKIDSLPSYLKTVYDNKNDVKDIFATLDIKVDVRDNGVFPMVAKVLELEEPIKDFGTSEIVDWDKNVYGKPAVDIDWNAAYTGKAQVTDCGDDQDEFIAKLANS